MIQRDYLLRQSEKFGQAMAKLLAQLLGIEIQTERILIGNEAFCEMFGLDINELLLLSTDDLLKFLIEEKQFSVANVEQLADILFILSENADNAEKARLKADSLSMFEYAEKNDNNYSFGRAWKIEQLTEIKR